jgi:hypothetical protein
VITIMTLKASARNVLVKSSTEACVTNNSLEKRNGRDSRIRTGNQRREISEVLLICLIIGKMMILNPFFSL